MRKWGSNKEKEKEKDRERKAKQKESMSEEEKALLKERNRLNKQLSRARMSKQKCYGVKVKDRNRKKKVLQSQSNEQKDFSTPRVQEYRKRKREQQLIVKMPFKKTKLNRSEQAKVKRAANDLSTFQSPSKRAHFVKSITSVAKSSPRTKRLIEEKDREQLNTPNILNKIKGRKDNSANIVRRLITAAVIDEMPGKSMRKRAKELNVSVNTIRFRESWLIEFYQFHEEKEGFVCAIEFCKD